MSVIDSCDDAEDAGIRRDDARDCGEAKIGTGLKAKRFNRIDKIFKMSRIKCGFYLFGT